MAGARKAYSWKDPSRLALMATAAMAVSIAVRIFSLAVELGYGDQALYSSSDSDISTPQLMMAFADSLQILVLLCCITVGFWLVRVCRNAHIFRPTLKISPAWAVGWYFVPFASLVKPFESMSEIWAASTAVGERDKPRLLNWWWALFLISNILGAAAARANVTVLNVLVDLIAIAVSGIFIVMVRRLSRMQREKYSVWDVFDAPQERPLSVLERVST